MKMILHILLKDLRRQWREIGLFVFVCCEWAWEETHPGGWIWEHQRNAVPFLLFGLWMFIVIRAVHGECLVGDKEFWPTRPYRWWQLLSAKIFFCALVLNVPLLVAQIYLLNHAGIVLSGTIAMGLFLLQLEFLIIVTFPVAAIAAVTQSLVQWILTIAGLILFGIVLSWLPWGKLRPTFVGEENAASGIGAVMILGALLFLIIWQYARRGVWPARAALACAVCAIPLTILIAHTSTVRAMAYAVKNSPSFQLSLRKDNDGRRFYWRKDGRFGNTTIHIPVLAVPSDPRISINVDGMKLVLQGDGGWKWESGWINQTLWLAAGTGETNIPFEIPEGVADNIQKLHATGTLQLAYGMYRFTREEKIDTLPEKFEIAGVGTCRWQAGLLASGLNCSAPLHMPGILVARMSARESTCKSDEDAVPSDRHAVATAFESDGPFPIEFDPDPVRHPQLSFGPWFPAVHDAQNELRYTALCRGTPITVQTGHLEGRMQSSFVLGLFGSEKIMKASEQDTVTFDPKDE